MKAGEQSYRLYSCRRCAQQVRICRYCDRGNQYSAAECARLRRRESVLRAGAEIHEYQPTMFHCKLLIIDRLLVSVGSTDFDPRSFRLNDEANVNVYDATSAASQVETFEHDLAHSRRVTLADWQVRPWQEKLVEWAAGLMGAQP
jgi:phosphatidylserine/phosphatidylglycerophosphate/cardiolipin synthase-like enzyme